VHLFFIHTVKLAQLLIC